MPVCPPDPDDGGPQTGLSQERSSRSLAGLLRDWRLSCVEKDGMGVRELW